MSDDVRLTPIRLGGKELRLATYAAAADPDSLAVRRGDRAVFLEFADVAPFVREGSLVLDVGAHSGIASTYFLARNHPVVSFEPAPRNLTLLRAAHAANAFPQWTIVPCAVSEGPGTLAFAAAGPHGHIVDEPTAAAGIETVAAVSLDGWLDGHAQRADIGLVKIDVEGAEARVLQGAGALLSSAQAPPLFIESNGHCLAWFGETPASLRQRIAGFGYHIFGIRSKRPFRPTTFFPVDPDDFQARTVVNYFCVKDVAALRRTGARIAARGKSTAETLRDVAITLRGNEDERRYIGNAVSASPAIARHPKVREMFARSGVPLR